MKNIACFAAHPDDLEFTCTGTIYHFIKKGYTVIFVIITNGENGFADKNISRDVRIETRKNEQEKAAKILGVAEILFLNYEDGFLQYTDELRSELTKIIRKYKPEIVFSFDPANKDYDSLNLYHRDHRITAEAVFDACFAAKNKFMYGGSPHRIKKMYFYGTSNPNIVVNITDIIDLKLEILRCHKSQFSDVNRVENYVKYELSKRSEKYEFNEVFRVMEVRQIL